MLLTKRNPRFSWQRVKPAAVLATSASGSKLVYALMRDGQAHGIIFSRDKRRWWFRAVDGRDSYLAQEHGLTLAEARKALREHVRYMLGLHISRR